MNKIYRYGLALLLLVSAKVQAQNQVIDAIIKEANENSQLEVLAHEILPFVAKADCKVSVLTGEEGIVVLFAISDLSFIRVIETHSIFFKWHDTIKVRLYFPTSEISEVGSYLSAFKVN